MTLFQVLQQTGLPCAYSHFANSVQPPYIVYLGNGQDTFPADNSFYWNQNRYQIEYYFKYKNEDNEAAIEEALLNSGFLYEKSEDTLISNQRVYS